MVVSASPRGHLTEPFGSVLVHPALLTDPARPPAQGGRLALRGDVRRLPHAGAIEPIFALRDQGTRALMKRCSTKGNQAEFRGTDASPTRGCLLSRYWVR